MRWKVLWNNNNCVKKCISAECGADAFLTLFEKLIRQIGIIFRANDFFFIATQNIEVVI